MKRTLDRLFQKIAIDNLALYIVLITALISGLTLMSRSDLGALSFARVFEAGEFWHVFVFPFRIQAGPFFGNEWIGLFLFLYAYWLFASQLEAEQGPVRFTAYMFTGIILTTLAGLLGGLILPIGAIDALYIELAVFVALAYLNPDQTILLFFFIPVRIKWLAIVAVGLILLHTVSLALSLGPLVFLGPLFGLGNFLLFYGPDILQRTARTRRSVIQRAPFENRKTSHTTIHRCAICEMTEHDDPTMDFRFCVDCDDREYCARHLADHTHVRAS